MLMVVCVYRNAICDKSKKSKALEVQGFRSKKA